MALPLPAERYVESIGHESERFLAATTSAPDASVAACPGWTNTDLLDHMGDVFNFAATQVRAAAAEMARPDLSAKSDAESDAESWYRQSADAVIAALAAADPDATGWCWAGIPTLSFYFRRMASEIAVHRIDAQRAAGSSEDAIAPDIATDALDEVMEVGMRFRLRTGENRDFPAGSLHLHRTDGDGEWMLVAGPDGLVVTHEHAKGDAAVRGSAHDLLLYLWGRETTGVEIFGDADVAASWAAVAP